MNQELESIAKDETYFITGGKGGVWYVFRYRPTTYMGSKNSEPIYFEVGAFPTKEEAEVMCKLLTWSNTNDTTT